MNKSNNVITLLVIFVILEVVAYINAFQFDLKAASVDSGRFQDEAVIWARGGQLEFVTDAQFFFQYLGIIFRVFGESEFVATQFGIAALMYGLIFMRRTMWTLGINYANLLIFFVAVWPSSITRVTTTMREPYLILFVSAICFYMVLHSKRPKIEYLFYALAWALVGSLFHKAYAVLFVGIAVYIFLFSQGNKKNREPIGVKIVKVITLVLIFLSFIVFENTISQVKGLKPVYSLLSSDTEYMSRITEYKANRDFRTTYDARVVFDSPITFIITAPKAYVYYMFSPFPWVVSTPIDVYAMIEAWIRLLAIFLLIRAIRKEQWGGLRSSTLIIIMLTLVWAAGTANYGTASRHHITTNWFFFILIAAQLTLRKRGSAGKVSKRKPKVFGNR